MSDYVAALVHDAIRSQGLVPGPEDVHFGACSTDYRTRLIRAFHDCDFDPEELQETREDLERTETELANAEDKIRDLDSEKTDLERDLERASKQLNELQKESA